MALLALLMLKVDELYRSPKKRVHLIYGLCIHLSKEFIIFNATRGLCLLNFSLSNVCSQINM